MLKHAAPLPCSPMLGLESLELSADFETSAGNDNSIINGILFYPRDVKSFIPRNNESLMYADADAAATPAAAGAAAPVQAPSAAPVPAAGGWGDMFKPKPGEWRCDSCLCTNKPDATLK